MPEDAPFKAHDKDHLEQGDILSGVKLVKWTDEMPTLSGGKRVIVTSNGCTCEDYERYLKAGQSERAAKHQIQIAPVTPAKSFPEDKQELIRAGKHLDYFFVYGEDGKLPDHVADLTKEQPLPARLLVTCSKVACVADWQWNRLLVHMAVSRFHMKAEKIFRDEWLRTDDAA